MRTALISALCALSFGAFSQVINLGGTDVDLKNYHFLTLEIGNVNSINQLYCYVSYGQPNKTERRIYSAGEPLTFSKVSGVLNYLTEVCAFKVIALYEVQNSFTIVQLQLLPKNTSQAPTQAQAP